MTWKPDRAKIDRELEELGVRITSETRHLLELLATDPHALYSSLSTLSESHVPADDEVPPVDQLVAEHFATHFRDCTEKSMLRKSKPISTQCKRLLAILIRDLGTPVPLPELLLANGLRSATPRRLRELETEHGGFLMRTYSLDGVQHYLLESREPDVDRCCRYWIKANLRKSPLSEARRVLGLLSAHVGTLVPRRDLDYILPEATSPGRGLARVPGGHTDNALGELRERGYAIAVRDEGVILESLA